MKKVGDPCIRAQHALHPPTFIISELVVILCASMPIFSFEFFHILAEFTIQLILIYYLILCFRKNAICIGPERAAKSTEMSGSL